MSLSEQEQRALREIEQSLLAEDPRFGSSSAQEQTFNFGSGTSYLKSLAIGVVGLVMLIGGVALAQNNLWFIALSIAGFLVMFGAGIWALRGGGAKAPAQGGSAQPRMTGGQSTGDSSGVSSRMEENFRKRFEGQ